MPFPGSVQLGGIPSTTALPTVRRFSSTSVIDLGVPFSQTNWPNPTIPVNAVLVDFIDQSIIGFVIPFSQTDWTNPQQPRQNSLSFSSSTAHLFPVNQQPAFSNVTLVPPGPTATEPGFVDQSIWALVIPFNQTNWPNPVRSPVTPLEFHDTFSRPVVVQSPLNQTNWPNPVKGIPPSNSSLGSISGAIIGIVPFSQQDWPNPTRGSVPTQGWIDTYNRPTVATQFPFGNRSYDLPPRAHRPNQSWTDSYPNRTVVVQVPFFSTSTFDVPRGYTATEPGFVDQAIFAFAVPLLQSDFPNPRGPEWRPASLGFIDGTIIGIDPFSQQDWPNPTTRQPTIYGWVDNFPNRGPTAPPFAQLNWPNPQRAVVLPFWWTDSYNRTPVAIGNPFSQKDWPNPKGPAAIHAVGVIPYATVLIPLPPPPPPSTEPDWKPFLVTMGKLMGMG